MFLLIWEICWCCLALYTCSCVGLLTLWLFVGLFLALIVATKSAADCYLVMEDSMVWRELWSRMITLYTACNVSFYQVQYYVHHKWYWYYCIYTYLILGLSDVHCVHRQTRLECLCCPEKNYIGCKVWPKTWHRNQFIELLVWDQNSQIWELSGCPLKGNRSWDWQMVIV